MGLSHGFQAHFVNNANYNTLIILFTMELLKLLVNDKTSPYNWRKADFVHPGFFHLSPLESTALTTQDLNFSRQFLLWCQEYSKDCWDTECLLLKVAIDFKSIKSTEGVVDGLGKPNLGTRDKHS